MYKIKLMNYQKYEYELLQDELNKMAMQGYETKHIHWITIFQKTNENYHYIVDLFHPEGQSHYDKDISRQRFLDPYLDHDYQIIFHKKGFYVFKGKTNISNQSKKKTNPISNKEITKSFLLLITIIILASYFYLYSQQAMTIDSLASYGSTLLYIGLLLLLLSLIYQLSIKNFYLSQLKNHFKNGKHYAKKSILKIHHILYTILFILSSILIIGGSIEDALNAKSMTIQEHPIMTLNDININQETITSYNKHSGFQIPQYYHYLEYTQDEKYILQVKEYIMNSQENALDIWNELATSPKQYQCDNIKKENNIIYGYTQNQLTSLIIVKEKHVYCISVNFDLTTQQINTILKQYQ